MAKQHRQRGKTMKKSILYLILFLLIASPAWGATIDTYTFSTTDDLGLRYNSTYMLHGFPFTSGGNYTVASVTFKNRRLGAVSGNVWAEIRTNNAGAPGTVLTNGTSVVKDASTIGTSFELVTYTFAIPPTVTAGSYWVVFNGDYSPADVVNIGTNIQNPGGNATYYISTYNSSTLTWTVRGYCGYFVVTSSSSVAVATPTVDNGTSTYNNDVSVTISCTTSGATICYTTDGTDPTATTPGTCANGTTYTVPVSITATATVLKAIGTKATMDNSTIASATYTLTNAAVTASPAAGTYLPTNSVTLSTTTTGGTIRYTTNGDTPACPSTGTLYSAPFTTATTQTVKAIGCKTNYNASAVLSAVYTIRVARPHYVSNAGIDSNDGLSIGAPWRSISKINNSSFLPGDSILLNKSDTWRHSPTIPSAGTVGTPLTISSYGTGNKPIIMGGDSTSAGWNAIRNGQLVEYTDGGASNDSFVGYTTNWGGSVKADVVAGVVSAKLSRVGAYAYIVTTNIWLPANTEVSFTYDAK